MIKSCQFTNLHVLGHNMQEYGETKGPVGQQIKTQNLFTVRRQHQLLPTELLCLLKG